MDPGHSLLPGLGQNGSMQPLDAFAIIKVSVLCTGESEIVSRVELEFRSSLAAAAVLSTVEAPVDGPVEASTGQYVLGLGVLNSPGSAN